MKFEGNKVSWLAHSVKLSNGATTVSPSLDFEVGEAWFTLELLD